MSKPKRSLEDGGRRERANAAKAANARERNIAQQYLNAGPSIGNLARAAYHWWNSVPMLGGQDESGNILIKGDAPSPSYKASALKTIGEGIEHFKNASDKGHVVNQANKMLDFINSAKYRARLYRFFERAGHNSNDAYRKANLSALSQSNRIKTAKVRLADDGTITDVDGNLYATSNGLYEPSTHTITLERGSLHKTTPAHEMWHASDKGSPIFDNASYAMRVKRFPGETEEEYAKRLKYYGDIVEQRPRVMNTLRRMDKEGYDINNLSNDDIEVFFDRPIESQWKDTQSLLDNYEWEDIPRALRNFKNVAIPIIATGVGYGVNKMHTDEQRPKQRNGSSIHIAPSKRGTFTAAATKHGMGVQEFASRVLRNKDNYSPAMVKKANFARNASKWNH